MHHRHMFLFGAKEVKKTQHLLGLEPVRQSSPFLSIDCYLASTQVCMWPVEGQPMEEHAGQNHQAFFASGELPSGERLFWAGCSQPCYNWFLQSRMWILLSPPIWLWSLHIWNWWKPYLWLSLGLMSHSSGTQMVYRVLQPELGVWTLPLCLPSISVCLL